VTAPDRTAVDAAAVVLERRAGLRFDATGRDRLARALAAAAGQAGVDPLELARRLDSDAGTLADLQDRVTLQETSWFRDPAVWEQIAARLLPAARAADGRVVLWSAGCANGQEAYSLAIACEEAGLRDHRIVATDVSRVATARTAAGFYEERELRGLSPERRARWLRPVPGGFEVVPALRRAVTVVDENLSSGAAAVADGTCGLVLCRYVLIYLSPAAVDATLQRFERALTPGGHLVIGAAESLWHLSDRFVLEPLRDAFAYRARAGAPPATRAAGRDARPAVAPARPPAAPPAPVPVPPPAPARAIPASVPEDPAALLRAGEQALAAGHLEVAIARFRGAAYLEPGNPIAHLQLGLALERAGDPGAGRAFRAAWSALRSADEDALRDALGGYRAQELVHLVAAKLGQAS
jgi:chemotaxis methyl-accepting protein methylase